MDINAILNFAGGLLGFVAVVIPLIVRFLEGHDPSARRNLLSHLIFACAGLSLVGAMAAVYIWHSPNNAQLLYYGYILFISWAFGRTWWPPTRWEIVMFVVPIALIVGNITYLSFQQSLEKHTAGLHDKKP